MSRYLYQLCQLSRYVALAIPAGFRNDGLPFGVTLLSHKFNDYALLDLASRYLKLDNLRTCGVSQRKCLPSMMNCTYYQNLPRRNC